QAGEAAVGLGEAGPDPAGDSISPRGISAANGRRKATGMEQPGPFLCRGGRGHAPHPGRTSPPQAPTQARWRQRVDLDEALCISDPPSEDLVTLDIVLTRFEAIDPLAAKLVK